MTLPPGPGEPPPEAQQPEARQPENDWDAADVLLFFGLALPTFFVLFLLAGWVLKAAGVQSSGMRLLLPQFAGYLGALLPLWGVFRGRHGVSPMRALRMGVNRNDAARSLTLGILTAISITAASVLLRTPQIPMPMEELLRDLPTLLMAAVLGVTLGPWFEELVFRGMFQPLFGRYIGALPAIVVSSLLFALLHGPQYAWSWRHVLLITVAGSAFGLRRHRTDSTGAAAVMHAAYNGVLFAAFLAGRWMGAGPALSRTFGF